MHEMEFFYCWIFQVIDFFGVYFSGNPDNIE
jgi:hypothetical protein